MKLFKYHPSKNLRGYYLNQILIWAIIILLIWLFTQQNIINLKF
ncbi:hypothetical protein SAMN02927903_00922 [Flavobacterium caeni]|uniref:Uncharacterized protein n=1 Tax=Flavobacterium caeni TaxID=490189 RepID=A0A1G5E2Y2_9FLAO|nr:hypothetical protein SAMN02927903_00922 [Flavobacterium caeni]